TVVLPSLSLLHLFFGLQYGVLLQLQYWFPFPSSHSHRWRVGPSGSPSPPSSPPLPHHPTFSARGQRGPPASTSLRKGKCIARSDTQDDNTDPSNSDSHGLNDLPAKLPLQDLGRHLAERCAQLLDEAMREIKILTQETQEVMQALASKHSEEFTLVISDVMEAIQAEHAQVNARLHRGIEDADAADVQAAAKRKAA
ncbi:Os05g0561800, partial [Oryza sativa Japonica Group]